MIRFLQAGAVALMLILLAAGTGVEAETMTETSENLPARHTGWTGLLTRYVQPSQDGVNRFDYARLKASPADRVRLDAYIAALSETDFETLSDDEAFVSWVNLYNALTVRLIVENYPVRSITRIKPSLFAVGPWKQDIITVGGRQLSLDDIEHNILRRDWDEPRIHYAVNCASVSCPDLMARAWEAATLDQDLDRAARAYVNSSRGVRIRRNGTLAVSTIYKWYRKDFGNSEAGVIAHLLEHAEPELAAHIRANPDITDYDYDWSLNEAETSAEHGRQDDE